MQSIVWNIYSSYLKVVDKYNEWLVSSYLTPSGMRFMLLHEARNEDGIKIFFWEIHEMFLKVSIQPILILVYAKSFL